MLDPQAAEDALRKGKQGIAWDTKDNDLETEDDVDIRETVLPAPKRGFWWEGEPGLGQDEDYYGDDLTGLGHGELQQHRELREYARLIAWELPLLHRTYMHSPTFRPMIRIEER